MGGGRPGVRTHLHCLFFPSAYTNIHPVPSLSVYIPYLEARTARARPLERDGHSQSVHGARGSRYVEAFFLLSFLVLGAHLWSSPYLDAPGRYETTAIHLW